MDKFRQMDTMIYPDGSTLSIAQFKEAFYKGAKSVEVYKNKTHMVIKTTGAGAKGMPDRIWLSVKRNDRESFHDWRVMQDIKNQLVGRYHEMVELYPAESRKVDCANQYHIWGFDDPKFRFPFGFDQRRVESSKEAAKIGAKQRDVKQWWQVWKRSSK